MVISEVASTWTEAQWRRAFGINIFDSNDVQLGYMTEAVRDIVLAENIKTLKDLQATMLVTFDHVIERNLVLPLLASKEIVLEEARQVVLCLRTENTARNTVGTKAMGEILCGYKTKKGRSGGLSLTGEIKRTSEIYYKGSLKD